MIQWLSYSHRTAYPSHPKETLHSSATTPYTPYPQPLASSILLSVSMNLPVLDTSYK